MYFVRTRKLWCERLSDGRTVTAKTKTKLKEKLLHLRDIKDNGLPFGKIAEEWADYHFPTLATNTLKGYKPALKRAIQNFGEKQIKTITCFELQNYIFSFHKAEKTVKTQILIFNLIFKYAVIRGYTDRNVARELITPKNLSKTKIHAPASTEIEQMELHTEEPFYLFSMMALYTGMRKSELLALEWDDIDLDKKEIRVTKSLCWSFAQPIIKSPKTKNGIRVIPIVNKLSFLEKGKGLVFPYKGGYWYDSAFRRAWKKYQEKIKTNFNPHQLRHAYATMLVERDMNPRDAQYLMGHANISTTIDIYADIRERQKERIKREILDLKW